ncbi:hypothetical protein SAMN04488101_107147 [Pedobacter nyackensis]|uniref:TolB-like 6-blade propeller-like n=2 Tax=Pedobacter nyackensis TaxID=475255 RepID=A0A1W2DL52_9SPHI|nr:hypothetical protein SAMN04488101_107147 [Pedobacter nyackensis]
MKKKVIIISLVLCLSCLSMIVLYIYSNRNSNVKNGFVRTFSKEKILLKGKAVLVQNSYAIADISPEIITIYNALKPYEITTITTDFKSQNTYKLPFPTDKEKLFGLNKLAFIGSSKILLTGRTAAAYATNANPKSLKTSQLDRTPFYNSEILNPNSFVFVSKKMEGKAKRKELKRVNWQGKELYSYLPEKQIDGYYCTDGQLSYDTDAKLLTYMFYYRGEFICLDTLLNVVYHAKTIDTVKYAKIKLKHATQLVNGKKINKAVPSTPPNVVNKRICMTADKVYMHSNLKADNETSEDFNNSQVIDVYDLKNGQYTVSFYLPRVDKKSLTAFRVYKNSLIALYHNTLVMFDLNTR